MLMIKHHIEPAMNPTISLLTLSFIFFFFFFCLTIPTSTSFPDDNYCKDVVPASVSAVPWLKTDSLPHFQNAYFTGGHQILGPRYAGTSFQTQKANVTGTPGVVMIDGVLTFWKDNFTSGRTIDYGEPSGDSKRRQLKFPLRGFWDQAEGKMCMVGSGTSELISVDVGFKLHYSNSSTLDSSLVTGTLECLNSSKLSCFDKISILGFSPMGNYKQTEVDKENENGEFRVFDGMQIVSLGYDAGLAVCSAIESVGVFYLESMEDCGSVSCDPLGGGRGGILPDFMSFNILKCASDGRVRYLLHFSNTSYNRYKLPFNPSTVLVAEGLWNETKKRLDLVACRISNVTDTLANASLGDCSIRLSLRFPSTLSLRRRSTVVGQMWSNKSINESGYLGRISFESPRNDNTRVLERLRYEYTEVEHLNKSCTRKITGEHKNRTYPNAYSDDMSIDMRARNTIGQNAWGYSYVLFVGEQPAVSAVHVKGNQSGIANISYVLSFNREINFLLGGEELSRWRVEISAEGTYYAETGLLCMRGCRHLESQNKRLPKNESLDCEIFINILYPPLNTTDRSIVKGTIESNRSKSDPLRFERIKFVGYSMYSWKSEESIRRMDLEIVMVIISNTLACIFAGLQLFHVKKNANVLPFISIVMLSVLTLALVIPLVLNFEAWFVSNRNRQNVSLGSGGWLEVNEVLVRVITMVAFLLQFRLLQQTWSARVGGDKSWNRLWVSDQKVLYFSLPLYIGCGLLVWFVHLWKNSYNSRLHIRDAGFQEQSFWGGFKSFAGLVLDGFLLPQIVFNVFCDCKERALTPFFYVGTTIVRLLPHAYDLYRAGRASPFDFADIYANPRMDYYSTVWDITISCGGLVFIALIYLQQRFGGRCFLPKRFRASAAYERVPIVASTELTSREREHAI